MGRSQAKDGAGWLARSVSGWSGANIMASHNGINPKSVEIIERTCPSEIPQRERLALAAGCGVNGPACHRQRSGARLADDGGGLRASAQSHPAVDWPDGIANQRRLGMPVAGPAAWKMEVWRQSRLPCRPAGGVIKVTGVPGKHNRIAPQSGMACSAARSSRSV